jgi:hypothetical protein
MVRSVGSRKEKLKGVPELVHDENSLGVVKKKRYSFS